MSPAWLAFLKRPTIENVQISPDGTRLAVAERATAIKVPVLIVHGKLDARVDIAHARRMTKALRQAGVEVESHEYTNAGHGLMLDADKVDFYTRLLAFLAKHTQARTGAGARTADAQ